MRNSANTSSLIIDRSSSMTPIGGKGVATRNNIADNLSVVTILLFYEDAIPSHAGAPIIHQRHLKRFLDDLFLLP